MARGCRARSLLPAAYASRSPVTCHLSPVTRRTRGFTLLEVIVSLAVMAVGLVAVLEAYGAASRLSLQDEYLTRATLLAQWKMEEVEKEPSITVGSEKGGFGDEFPEYDWSVDIEDSPIQGLEMVTVTVNWEVAGREDQVTLVSALPQSTAQQGQSGQQPAAGAGGGGA